MSFVVPPVGAANAYVRNGRVVVPVWRAADHDPVVVVVETAGTPCAVRRVPSGRTVNLTCAVGRHWTVSATADGVLLGRWSG